MTVWVLNIMDRNGFTTIVTKSEVEVREELERFFRENHHFNDIVFLANDGNYWITECVVK